MQNAKITPRSSRDRAVRDRARASVREIALALALTVGALVFLFGAFGPPS